MPQLTPTRLQEIKRLGAKLPEVLQLVARGRAAHPQDFVSSVVTAIADINAALAEIEEMLLAGLRAEALSMHDPEIVVAARLLDLRRQPDWVHLHGWLLENGLSVPANVRIDVAEQFAGLDDDDARGDPAVQHLLERLRRLALERAPLAERLAVLRQLRRSEPGNETWLQAILAHEERRLGDIRREIPLAKATADLNSLAAIASELRADDWETAPSPELLRVTEGADSAGRVSDAAAEAEAIAAVFEAGLGDDRRPPAAEIDQLVEARCRIDELVDSAAEIKAALAEHPDMRDLVERAGPAARLAAAVERVADRTGWLDACAAELKCQRDHAAACQQLEYLCDHLPEPGAVGEWLADLHRADATLRACCQEMPQLQVPLVLKERVQRSAATVESGEQLRRRSRTVTALMGLAVVLLITAGVGWFTLRWAAYSRSLSALTSLAEDAGQGLYLETPAVGQGIIDRYSGVVEIDALGEAIAAGLEAEAERGIAFAALLADHGEQLETVRRDVDDREAAGGGRWLEAWPESFVNAAMQLAEARRIGGLPERRGIDVPRDRLPAKARNRFDAEEKQLADAEKAQVTVDRRLEQLAAAEFDRLAEPIRIAIRDPANASASPNPRKAIRELRQRALSPKAAGLPSPFSDQTRVAPEVVAELDSYEVKLGR